MSLFLPSNAGVNKIADDHSMSLDALAFLFAGILGIPSLAMGCIFFCADSSYLRHLESLPALQGQLYVCGFILLFVLPTIAFVGLFPIIARRFFPGSRTLVLYENGLAILDHGQPDKFHVFEDFDRILIEQTECYVTLEFFRGEGSWFFSLQENDKKSTEKFARVVQLANSFPQGRPRQGPSTEFRSLL